MWVSEIEDRSTHPGAVFFLLDMSLQAVVSHPPRREIEELLGILAHLKAFVNKGPRHKRRGVTEGQYQTGEYITGTPRV